MVGAGIGLALLGLVLLLVGVFVHAAHILLWIGIVVAVVGVILMIVNRVGRGTPV